MPDHAEKFTPYNDGEHGLLIGYADKVKHGQRLRKGLTFYSVEEVTELGRGIWSASLKRTEEAREL